METNLKFNSQICTTKIQSERLIALGLKKETADIVIRPDNTLIVITENSFIYHNLEKATQEGYCPAWSLHRLIEIAGIMAFSPVSSIDGWYDDIIAQIQSLIHIGYIDEKYLNMDIVNAKENENMELLKNVTK